MCAPSQQFACQVQRDYLGHIVHMSNVPSIIEVGIFSHNRMKYYEYENISLADVQDRRAETSFEKLDTCLHDYANLYFDARNPMMYYLKYNRNDFPESFCVLKVSFSVLDIKDVLVTDSNAAYGLMRYGFPGAMIEELDFAKIFARYWTDQNEIEESKNKAKKCAEVLVPDLILPSYINGACVANERAKMNLYDLCPELDVTVDPDLFFG